jgi:PIN domain nuclease of toxin-antitoxin system
VNLLLDTHIWLWAHTDPKRLSPRVARALESPRNDLWLSPISIWELLLLAESGRIKLRRDPVQWVHEALVKLPLREAVLNQAVAIESRRLALDHQDPADRFLAATARVYALTLVTTDERLLAAKDLATFGN